MSGSESGISRSLNGDAVAERDASSMFPLFSVRHKLNNSNSSVLFVNDQENVVDRLTKYFASSNKKFQKFIRVYKTGVLTVSKYGRFGRYALTNK